MSAAVTKSPADRHLEGFIAEWLESGGDHAMLADALFAWALSVELNRVGAERLTHRLAHAIQHVGTVAAKVKAAA